MTVKDKKRSLGLFLIKYLKNNQVIGLGSGSTVKEALNPIAKHIKENNLNIQFISSSVESTKLCKSFDLDCQDISTSRHLDWTFDGVDYIGKDFLIKGGGAALYREKILAKVSREYFIIADDSKLKSQKNSKIAVPVEVSSFSLDYVILELRKLGAIKTEIREVNNSQKTITDNGNYLIDCYFEKIGSNLEQKIKLITGVIESGIFANLNPQVLIANDLEVYKLK